MLKIVGKYPEYMNQDQKLNCIIYSLGLHKDYGRAINELKILWVFKNLE